MTTDEAIERIEKCHCSGSGIGNCSDDCMFGDEYCEYAMAIEALKQQKTMPTIEQSMMKEFRLEVENSDLRRQIEILKKQLDKYKENNQ